MLISWKSLIEHSILSICYYLYNTYPVIKQVTNGQLDEQ